MKTAFILGAGLGTRMRPWTFYQPKPLLPLFNKPVIFWHIDTLIESGFNHLIINTHHLNHKLEGYVKFYVFEKLKRNDIIISILEEEPILGTGGALYNAGSLVDEEQFLLVNSDIIHKFNISDLIEFHNIHSPLATLVIRKTDLKRLRQVSINSQNEIESIGPLNIEQQTSSKEYGFTGMHIISSKIFDYVEKDTFQCIVRDVYKRACLKDGKKLMGFITKDYWNDIGNVDDYLNVHRDILNGKFRV